MKKTILAVLILASITINALAVMMAPPTAPAGWHYTLTGDGIKLVPLVFMDPTDTNNWSTNFVPQKSGMFIEPLGTNVNFCVGSVSDTVSFANTNLTFGGANETLQPSPWQTVVNSGQRFVVLFPHVYATRTTNTPVFKVSVWNTLTNDGTHYETNTITVELQAGQGVYAAQILCTNLSDWTNCFPVAITAEFANSSFTATNLWYPKQVTGYRWARLKIYLNNLDWSLHLDSTPDTNWKSYRADDPAGPYTDQGDWYHADDNGKSKIIFTDPPSPISQPPRSYRAQFVP